MKQVSIFDLDHTLLSVNSSFVFGKYLYSKRYFSFLDMFYMTSCYLAHVAGAISIPSIHRKIFKRLFLGRPLAHFEKAIQSFLDASFSHFLNLPVVELLKKAQQNGERVIILSSSPDFIVGPIAKRLNVDEWVASQYAIDNDFCLCHIASLMQGVDKAQYVAHILEKDGILKNAVTAYSDSHHDLPLLKVAGRAVAVNPDRKLRKLCHNLGWDILEV